MRQMRRNVPFSEIEKNLKWADTELLQKAYKKMPVYDDGHSKSLASLAVMLASYILTEDIFTEEFDYVTESVTSYIREPISGNITVRDICRGTNISKNTLYKNVRLSLGMSVNEYILSEKIRLAQTLLRETKEPVSSICEQVGIANSSYFCKLFRQKTRTSPMKYRKTNQI